MPGKAAGYTRYTLLLNESKNPGAKAPGFWIFLLSGINADLFAVAANTFKFDSSVNQSEKCIIAADAYVFTGMDMGSTLTNQNVAGQNCLTVSTLYAQSLGLGITAVLGRTYALFMSKELNAEL